ncbi:MAG: hypothetical protein D6731_15370 [Planctomycetota bacterium]|nr:MAG: hypothetical protein D6731_15370 [Planctomycetota bacterium]
MEQSDSESHFPPVDLVRRGPPVDARGLSRQGAEKWARVMLVVPRPLETSERVRYDFVEKGPITLPLAVRREGTDAGSKDAWLFFTHPHTVFPADATFYNVPGRGCLGARLACHGNDGVRLYDEVGAGLPRSERVADSFAGALGVLRQRVLGEMKEPSDSELARDMLELDLDLLELFNLTVDLLRAENPLRALSELYPHLLKPSVHHFAWDAFDEREHDVMRALADGERSSLREMSSAFRVIRRDFTRVADVRDARGRQAILELLQEYEAFEREHAETLADLGRRIQAEEERLAEVRAKVRQLQRSEEQSSRVGRLLSRRRNTLRMLRAEAVKALRAKRELEARYHQIPGYERLEGLTRRVQGFEAEIRRVFELARDMVEHTVSRDELDALRALVEEKILSEDPAAVRAGYRQYSLRLRAEVLPKLLMTYSLSAYVLRRPDALVGEASRRNVLRINDLAHRLIEYFRYVRYGKSTLGDAWDETWGQVVALEARL